MKAVTNERRVARNARIGNWSTVTGLATMGVGLYVSIKWPAYISFSFVCLLVGVVLSNVGLYNTIHWVKRPRADEVLIKTLKGFDKRYYLYNYTLPVNHVLLSPSGLFVIVARNQDGPIHYAGGRWRQKLNLFRIFGFAGEAVGNPLRDAGGSVRKVQKFLAENAPQVGEVPVQPLIVFTSEKATLHVQDPPLPVLDAKGLKEHLRGLHKDALSGNQIRQMVEVFGEG
jgi:hypothetical protein